MSVEGERGKVTTGAGNRGEKRVSMLKRVRGPKITRNSWKSAYMEERMREKGASKEGDRSNEVDSLFSVFSANGRESIGRLSGRRFFSHFAPFYVELTFLPRISPSGTSLSFFLSHSIMRPSCCELLRLVSPLFLYPYVSVVRKTSSNRR